MLLEKILESPLDCKEIQPVRPKGSQSWMLIGRTDVEAETPILWPPDAKNWLIGKDPDAGKDWRRRSRWLDKEEKGMAEDEMVGWHHQLNDMILDKVRELVIDRKACHAAVHGVAKSWTELCDWMELNISTKNLLELLNEIKLQDTRLNIKKLLFFYTPIMNIRKQKEENNSFYTCIKKIKIPRNKLHQEGEWPILWKL